jgi:hypothetical protein
MPTIPGGFKYLRVLWITFPYKTEKAREVIKGILKEMSFRFALPWSIQSDSRPTFISRILGGISQMLGIHWRRPAA